MGRGVAKPSAGLCMEGGVGGDGWGNGREAKPNTDSIGMIRH